MPDDVLMRYIILCYALFFPLLSGCSESGTQTVTTPEVVEAGTEPTTTPQSNGLNGGLTGSFLYQDFAGQMSFSRLDLQTGKLYAFPEPDWDDHFGPLGTETVQYYATSASLKESPGLIVVAKRAFSDGKVAVITTDKNGKTENIIRFLSGFDVDLNPQLSLDGRYIALSIQDSNGLNTLQIRSVEGELLAEYETRSRNLRWLSSGQLLMDGWTRGFELTEPLSIGPGRIIEIGTEQLGVIVSWDLSPDGSKVAYGFKATPPEGVSKDEYTTQLRMLDLATGEDRTIAISRPIGVIGDLYNINWSPDGKWVTSHVGKVVPQSFVSFPPIAVIPTNASDILYIDPYDTSSPNHSAEINFLKRLVDNDASNPIANWPVYDYNWVSEGQ